MDWLWRRGREDDLGWELRAHLELDAEERAGDLLAAQRALGDTAWIKEETRYMWGWNSLFTFWQDVRYGVRLVRRAPMFSIFAAASLGQRELFSRFKMQLCCVSYQRLGQTAWSLCHSRWGRIHPTTTCPIHTSQRFGNVARR
jgi:hypothetical protein